MDISPGRIAAWLATFDDIRQRHRGGTEYWSARDLMPLLGYASWQDFERAVARAQTAARNIGADVTEHFAATRKEAKGGRWGRYTVADLNLSRLGCYLLAMNCDPRKPAVATAQSLFAIKARMAETAQPGREMTQLELLDTLRKAELNRSAAEQQPCDAGDQPALW